MKKFNGALSAFLVAAMLAGVLVSCAGRDGKTGITATSSDAEQYAEWLNVRLGDNVTGRVIVGIGSDDSYAVDMTGFEDDGYIIKSQADQTVIFGKSADGLDRGVRKYANSVDMDETLTEFTYHEGERIEELRLFGTDISEFTIVYANDANDNMIFAANEMQMLVEKATGHLLPLAVQSESDAVHKIELRHTNDAELKNDGYRYFEENGSLIIEGALARGSSNGVYRFLQNECGWDSLIYGESYLNEAELIEIPAGISKSETPQFDLLWMYLYPKNDYTTDRTPVDRFSAELSYGPHDHAHHGMQRYMWTETSVEHVQICHSSEGQIETATYNILEYIREHNEAGSNIKDIDVSAGDNNQFCMCTDCMESYALDKSRAGAVVYFANRIAEAIEDAGYEGFNVHIFAYLSTKKPPEVTVPRDDVCITYAQNGNCSNHSMYGDECEYVTDYGDAMIADSNKNNDEWLSGWCDISDNVVVWYYYLDSVLNQIPYIDTLLEDMRYMKEHNIRGIFVEAEDAGYGTKFLEHHIMNEINWNNDMTEEEFESLVSALLRREYGDGWKNVGDYLEIMTEAADRNGCFNSWNYVDNTVANYDHLFVNYFSAKLIQCMENTIRLAGSAEQEKNAKLLSCSVYYTAARVGYYAEYETGDEAKREELREVYKISYNRLQECGYKPSKLKTIVGTTKMYPTIEEEAEKVWVF